MIKTFRYLLYACCAACGVSCSTTKLVGEQEYLLDRVKIVTDDAGVKAGDLKPYLRQTPNYKVFGILKWPLYVYNWAGRDKSGWLYEQLRRVGEPPVLMDTMLTARSKRELELYMTNKGYLSAEVSVAVDTSRRRKATVEYRIAAGVPHRIREYRVIAGDARIDSLVRLAPQRRPRFGLPFRPADDEYVSTVRAGDLFDRDVLNAERRRIAAILQNHGYYAFNPDYIRFTVDSANGLHLVDLELHINPFRYVAADGATAERPHRRYYVNRVDIVTDYDPLHAGDSVSAPTDSAALGAMHIYYGQNGRSLRPRALQHRNHIAPGEPYSEADVSRTYADFSAMRALRYVNIRHDEFEENDTMKLNTTILTTPAKVHGFGVETEGTNSAGDLGFAAGINYQHRNLFGGSELFAVKLRGAYEALSGQNDAGIGSYWEYAIEASIHIPTLLAPPAVGKWGKRLNATTRFEIAYNQQRRPEYRRAILAGGLSYSWQNRSVPSARHTLKLPDINYIHLPYIDRTFKDSLPLLTTLYNYNDQFIVGAGYTYSFNNYDPLKRGRNTHSLRIAFESAGNVLYALSAILDAGKNSTGRYELFGINYSQFVKADIDFARHFAVDRRNSVALHLGAGIGYPYGNARELPFERRYFAGGANNNRGWSVRSLGPGSMSTAGMTFVNQVGDIRLDASIEYRSKLFWKLELATYLDAGNIWTIRPYDYQPRGNFHPARFYREIALSYGLGVRLDFDYFLLRLDTGLKAYNPQAEGARRLAILHPNLGSNFAWHFAVGYPF